MRNEKAQKRASKQAALRNLTAEQLGVIAGGINPQPLPPQGGED